MTELRVLTVRQPWASLIAFGYKRIEVRSRPTSFRGWVAIHAAKAKPKRWWEASWRDDCPPVGHWLTIPGAARLDDPHESADGEWWAHEWGGPLAAIVAVARLTDSLPVIDEERGWTEDADTPDDVILVGSGGELDRYNVVTGFTADLRDQLPLAPADMWTPGHHGWMLDDVRPLDRPIPHKGGLGIRHPTLDLAQQLAPYCAEAAS